jgi:hemoglobin-like flavoprotein
VRVGALPGGLGSKKDEMVTAVQKSLVQASWQELSQHSVHVAELFYDRLFELDPSLEELFPQNLSVQSTKLMRAIGAVVRGLDDMERVTPMLQDLGRRHLDYGARPGHYVTMGKALLWTIEQSLEGEFPPRLKEAWAEVFAWVSSLMIDAANERALSGGGVESGPRRITDAPAQGIRHAG